MPKAKLDAAKVYAEALDFLNIKHENATVEEMKNLLAAALKLNRAEVSDTDLSELAEAVPGSIDHTPPAFDSFDPWLATKFPNASRSLRRF